MKKQAVNPYLPSYEYVPDGEPKIFEDRLYIYGSHDRFNGNEFCENDYVCWSAPQRDLSDWRYEGVIYRAGNDPNNPNGEKNLNAPDVVRGKDGRYYLYYQMSLFPFTCVAVSDAPTGPYEFDGVVRHQDGTPVGEKEGDPFAFDPGVLIDDDGRVYLYIGYAPVKMGQRKGLQSEGMNADTGFCLELDQDMKTMKGSLHPLIPGHYVTGDSSFKGHGFFEASSPRKINGKYYLIYSSELSHELCYATSDAPDRNFRYGGTIISIGDVGYHGRKTPDNYTGNTHGGMVRIEGQWYIFYHRQTNLQKCARQGCAEKIEILPDGKIPQVEMTSCGLNDGPLAGKGRYEARIACTLTSASGTIPCVHTHETDEMRVHPYFTQSGKDREKDPDQYIANMKDGAEAGFKYFRFKNSHLIRVTVRGTFDGIFCVKDGENGSVVSEIEVKAEKDWREFSSKLEMPDGIHPLYFQCRGKGSLDFCSFVLE